MSRFSKSVVERLCEAGWTPRRRIDTAPIEAAFEAQGFGRFLEPSASPLRFLREFGGLTLRHGTRERFCFRVLERTREQCCEYRSAIGREVWPVGVIRDGYFDLLVDEDEALYAGGDAGVFLLGMCIEDGIEFVCTRALKAWTLQAL